MIAGKDKEKVRSLKATIDQSASVFEKISKDLQEILDALKNDGMDFIGYPYCTLAEDIGRCEAMVDICKEELD